MEASRVSVVIESDNLDRQAFAESLPEVDASRDWAWIDSDRDDFYNDDMLMGCDA